MCNTLREGPDDLLGVSMEDRRQVGKELMGKFKGKSITLPEKRVKRYAKGSANGGGWTMACVGGSSYSGTRVICRASSSGLKKVVRRGGQRKDSESIDWRRECNNSGFGDLERY